MKKEWQGQGRPLGENGAFAPGAGFMPPQSRMEQHGVPQRMGPMPMYAPQRNAPGINPIGFSMPAIHPGAAMPGQMPRPGAAAQNGAFMPGQQQQPAGAVPSLSTPQPMSWINKALQRS